MQTAWHTQASVTTALERTRDNVVFVNINNDS